METVAEDGEVFDSDEKSSLPEDHPARIAAQEAGVPLEDAEKTYDIFMRYAENEEGIKEVNFGPFLTAMRDGIKPSKKQIAEAWCAINENDDETVTYIEFLKYIPYARKHKKMCFMI